MDTRDPLDAAGAAAGFLAWHGLEDFEKRIDDAVAAGKARDLRPAQRQWLAARGYDAEVNNGGHAQYFLNSTGDGWRDALAGLEAIGAKERHAILREAVAKFGESGPSENRGRRGDQLGRIMRADEEIFEALDHRYFASKEVLAVFAARYVAGRAEEFR